jgi:hypothetical protein
VNPKYGCIIAKETPKQTGKLISKNIILQKHRKKPTP